jgi:tetratricopeptide (TPR) repeat protein
MELTIDQALQQAVEAHKAGKLQDAEILYRAILQAQPNHPDANHNLGILAVSLNKTEAALPLFKIALAANPNQGQFWLSYIDALIKEKQFDNARNILEQGKKIGLAGEKVDVLEAQLSLIFLKPDTQILFKNKAPIIAQQHKKVSAKKEKKRSSPLSLTKSNQIKSPPKIELDNLLAYYKKGRLDLAQNLAATLTQQYPNHPFGWKVLGALFQQTGKLQESAIANHKVLEILPNDAETHSNLGNTLKELGRLEDAETICKKAIALKPNFAEAHCNLGNVLQELGRLEDAEISYKKAIAIKPDYAKAHSNLGNTLKELGRLEDAEASCKKAIALKPDFAEAHCNLGNALQELGRLEDAEISYKKAIAINLDFALAHSNLGNTLKELGRLEDAEASCKKAIALKPDFAEAHCNLGNALQALRRLEDAVISYKKAIAIKPDFALAHSNLGNTLKELGRLEDAEASCKKAIALKPDFAEAHCNLGIVLQELGRLEDAEISYKIAIAKHPDFAQTHSFLGSTLKELGRLEDAEISFAQAVKLKPDLIEARNELLTCLYLMDKKSLLFDQLDFLTTQDKTNSVIGSLTYRSGLRYGEERLNTFCNDPLKHVLLVDLKSRYDFEETFVRNVKSFLSDVRGSNRRIQPLLFNGFQTSGNLFSIENNFTGEIQKAIRLEIEKYRINFENSEEGFIKKWPKQYSLFGWLICMKSGGELSPHIHENGWLSGSIYINVPSKTRVDSGNLVVSMGKDSDTTNSSLNSKKVIDVTTGSMALFPASLMHHTIPFQSEEERIVLAFDVMPKST